MATILNTCGVIVAIGVTLHKRILKAKDVARLENTSPIPLLPIGPVVDVITVDGACIASECQIGAPCTGTDCAHCIVTCVLGHCVDSAGIPDLTAPIVLTIRTAAE